MNANRAYQYHGFHCLCGHCSEEQRLRETRVVHDAPTGALPAQSVSLHELVDNAPVSRMPHYEIGEDWSDD